MESKNYLIKQIEYLRRVEFYSQLSKLILLSLYVIISPFVIYAKIINSELFVALILIFAEIVLIVLSYNIFFKVLEFSSIKNSRIYQCIDNPELVNEVLVSNNKILFELKGIQDEALFLKNSDYRNEIIDSIRTVFGKTKVIQVAD